MRGGRLSHAHCMPLFSPTTAAIARVRVELPIASCDCSTDSVAGGLFSHAAEPVEAQPRSSIAALAPEAHLGGLDLAVQDNLSHQATDERLALVSRAAQVLHPVAVPHHGPLHAAVGANELAVCRGNKQRGRPQRPPSPQPQSAAWSPCPGGRPWPNRRSECPRNPAWPPLYNSAARTVLLAQPEASHGAAEGGHGHHGPRDGAHRRAAAGPEGLRHVSNSQAEHFIDEIELTRGRELFEARVNKGLNPSSEFQPLELQIAR
jgi:hypothetical protein